jgi:hypothetical protein
MARLTPAQARAAVARLKKSLRAKGEASDLFGLERGDTLAAVLATIVGRISRRRNPPLRL